MSDVIKKVIYDLFFLEKKLGFFVSINYICVKVLC